MQVAVVVLAGALGAPARYLLDGWVLRRTGTGFPWGTLVVNVCGSLLLGLVTGLARAGHLGPLPTAALGAGFCGSFTTFSTLSYETVRLLDEGSGAAAGVNVVANFVIGLGAAAAGLAIAGA